ncbi:MAG: hypothetical protein PWP76_507 [Candidatus Diapherotrites archaeon]|nr:hypothetical protein [Candidatus Diapherotrites archaeon]MDN5367037.1 hypothetical protein [Candidatus Diapherotrites archaeon]
MPETPTVEYVKHPLIKPKTVEARLYQQLITVNVLEKGNTLVVAPTALGKTIIAALVAAERLKQHPDGKVLMLAPTKPLAVQHAETFRRVMNIPEEKIVVLTGTTPPEKREKLWTDAKIIVATPQTVENDILSGRADLSNVVLVVFDEAHRAVGDYPYVFIAKEYMRSAKHPLILALTASPGGTEEKIHEVRQNLFIRNIEIKTPDDPDVRPYVKDIFVHWVGVPLPDEFREIKRLLENAMRVRLRRLKEIGVVSSADLHAYSKKDFIGMQEKIQQLIQENPDREELYEALQRVAEILKIHHALELLESQGITALHRYFERMELRSVQPRAPRSLRNVLLDPAVKEAARITKELFHKGYEHPKLEKLRELLSTFFAKNPDARAIVFVQYRDTAQRIVEELNRVEGIRAVRFVGQATKEGDRGLSQREQQRILQEFREGKYNVLVATSVAEEGLDIPAVDLVVFYEPVPSEIRHIQRRGRTGRFDAGRVYILVTKGTRDEAYYWAARARERKMVETLKKLRKTLEIVHDKGQKTITEFVRPEKPRDIVTVLVDHRERASGVIHALREFGDVIIQVKDLPVGDYVVSDRVAIERKSAADFVQSIIDGRLFEQASKLVDHFAKPVIIVEGESVYTVRNVHPNAIRGAIASLVVDYGIPVIFTRNERETAAFIRAIARREQLELNREPRLRGEKRILSLPEMQQFIVESLPYVGPKLAKQLLKHFGTVERVFTASERELAQVEGIGPKRAKEIRRVLTEPYQAEGDKEGMLK